MAKHSASERRKGEPYGDGGEATEHGCELARGTFRREPADGVAHAKSGDNIYASSCEI